MEILDICGSDTGTDSDFLHQNPSPPPKKTHKIPPPQDDDSSL